MNVCVNRLTALSLLRHCRAEGDFSDAERCGVSSPDPWPQHRWTRRIIPYQLVGLANPPSPSHPFEIAVPSASSRPKASFVHATVYRDQIPAGSFIRVSQEFAIPCPELLFLELASVMEQASLELVGYELCGTFTRDSANPRTGNVTHGVRPLTTVHNIRRYLLKLPATRTRSLALAALENVRDNAWSVMEAIVAMLLVRSIEQEGYGIPNIRLNVPEGPGRELRLKGAKEKRIPDIALDDLPVGFNYDGYGHLDLAAIDVGSLEKDEILAALVQVREKYVDDLRRNRELLAGGRIVLPIVAEDLFESGGLDAAVLAAISASERIAGMSGAVADNVRRALAREHNIRRQRLIWSLYPWSGGTSLGNY